MSERICSVVKPRCHNKPVWRFQYKEDDSAVALFVVEYCEDCYTHFKTMYPKDGWVKIVNG